MTIFRAQSTTFAHSTNKERNSRLPFTHCQHNSMTMQQDTRRRERIGKRTNREEASQRENVMKYTRSGLLQREREKEHK